MSNLAIDTSGVQHGRHHSMADTTHLLERSLRHGNADVKLLGLNEIERCINNQYESNICIELLLHCLNSEHESVAAAAVRILRKLLPQFLNDQSVRTCMQNVLASDATDLTRCRCYDLAIYIGKTSTESLQHVEFILERLCSDLGSDDILLLLNVLDFLADLAGTEHGFVYLENRGVLGRISKSVQAIDDTPFRDLLIPAYMKFFGSIAATKPRQVLQGFPIMIESLFACIMFGNSTALPVAFDTLGK